MGVVLLRGVVFLTGGSLGVVAFLLGGSTARSQEGVDGFWVERGLTVGLGVVLSVVLGLVAGALGVGCALGVGFWLLLALVLVTGAGCGALWV